MPTKYDQKIASQLHLRPNQIGATIDLLDSGNTLPFIARYRKEMTGGLDEDQIRQLLESVTRLRSVDERRETVLESIQEQGLLTPELQGQIEAAETLTELEDLYQPYKPKRRTRAGIAREKGLQPLADLILQQARDGKSAEKWAADFLNADVATIEDALAGARDIVAETISDNADVRGQTRAKALKFGLMQSQKTKDAKDEKGVYQLYYEFEYRLDRIKPYQVLAINRGEAEKVLRVNLDITER
ncbi:MAG TPA: Tex-like N-terminal domain-containing protein, partial [Phototrophicaceae bacterium]|nr:Tex-like N-terminal domain-containing protein [Phototrophicaceae bacterium]